MVETLLMAGEAVMVAGILLGIWKAFRGPHLLERILAYEMVAIGCVGIVVFHSALTGTAIFLDLVLIYTLLGFLTTVSFAMYMERARRRASVEAESPEEED